MPQYRGHRSVRPASRAASIAAASIAAAGAGLFAAATAVSQPAVNGPGPAAKLAAKLGKPARLLVGLGAGIGMRATRPIPTSMPTWPKQAFHAGIGNLSLIWWQTPLGVPSVARGATAFHYRDNRAHYFLTHPTELVAAGGLGVVFSTGANSQTNITTDAGEFQELDDAYLRSIAKLP